jgi:hypothetical protein
MTKSINQHWVPQFYLREFATPQTKYTANPQVWIFSKRDEDKDERLTSIRNVCAKRYLYTPRGKNGERSWEVDDDLEGVEALLGEVWSSISSGFVDLSKQATRKALSLFIATNHIRHPANLKIVRGIHHNLVRSYDRLPKKPDGTPDVDEFIFNGKAHKADTSDWHDYRSWSDDDYHRFFVRRIRREAGLLAKTMLTKRWSVVIADQPYFITSDRPVVLQHSERSVFGSTTHGAIISFPLSPTRLLVMDDLHEEPANQYYPLNPGCSAAFNFSIWHNSSRFMITGRSVPDVLTDIMTWAKQA